MELVMPPLNDSPTVLEEPQPTLYKHHTKKKKGKKEKHKKKKENDRR